VLICSIWVSSGTLLVSHQPPGYIQLTIHMIPDFFLPLIKKLMKLRDIDQSKYTIEEVFDNQKADNLLNKR